MFETGDIPTGGDYADIMDSFVHKDDLGTVAEGDESPVSGNAVYIAIRNILDMIDLRGMVLDLLTEILPDLLNDYVQSESLQSALEGLASQSWVEQQIAGKADATSVNTALGAKADADTTYTKTETDQLLEAKANANGVYTKEETDQLLQGKADTSTVPAVTGFVTQQAMASALAGKVSTETLTTLLMEKVNTTAFNSLGSRVSELEGKVGSSEEDTGLCKDMDDTMAKTNEVIAALKDGDSLLETVDPLQLENGEQG